jgi:hypothetical protein
MDGEAGHLCPTVDVESVRYAISVACYGLEELRADALASAESRRQRHSWPNALRPFVQLLEEST